MVSRNIFKETGCIGGEYDLPSDAFVLRAAAETLKRQKSLKKSLKGKYFGRETCVQNLADEYLSALINDVVSLSFIKYGF